jgi:RNA polymerase sporulation-specific sigma factor
MILPLEKKYDDNELMVKLAQNGDADARTRVYENNIGLVYMVLERFKSGAYEYEDLFQIGSIGLLKSIDKFDFAYNVRFSTYAVPMIIGEIKKFLRDDGIVKVQRGLKETYGKIRWAQEKLRGNLGREPGVAEIASFLEIDKEEIVLAMEACQTPAYMQDVMPGEKEQLSLIDRLTNEDGNVLMLEQMALREALSKLDDREREVLLRRYFKDETQMVIAEDLGVSQVQVSRIEKAALIKLKNLLE